MRRTRSSLAVSLVAVATLSLSLAACGGEKDPEAEPAAEAAEDAAPATWPLTGLPAGDEDVERKHPAMVLKMDNTSSSSPQVGLGAADLVVEELVEGGMTRLAVFYYSQLPKTAGPVRSMRASDIGIVAPVAGHMVTSGAAAPTIERIQDAGIEFFAEGGPGFYRESSRSAPYNLFTRFRETAAAAKQEAARPVDYLAWGEPTEPTTGQPASTLSASFSGGHTTHWTFEDGKYSNTDGYAAEGDEFQADTVLVLRVAVGDAGYTDPAGNPVPETMFEGKGAALLFNGGRVVRGTWSKEGLDSQLELATKAGPLTVPAGNTWIELVPRDGGDITFEK